MFWRRNSVLRFLLEGVEHVDDPCEAHSVDGAAGVAVMVVDHLEHASAGESLEGLGPSRLAAGLRLPRRSADSQSDRFREGPQVVATAPDPPDGLVPCLFRHAHSPYAIYGIFETSAKRASLR